MSSEVLERQLEDQHEVRILHISPRDPDCIRVINDTAVGVAERLNKAGWVRGKRVACLRGESKKKTDMVDLHPLEGTGAKKGDIEYGISKLGKLFGHSGKAGPWEPARLQSMDLMERKRLEILLGLNLKAD